MFSKFYFSQNNFFYCDLQDQIHSQIVQQKLDSTDHYLTRYSELNENNTKKKSENFENFFLKNIFFLFLHTRLNSQAKCARKIKFNGLIL
jgi:hypothetical protein